MQSCHFIFVSISIFYYIFTRLNSVKDANLVSMQLKYLIRVFLRESISWLEVWK